MPRTLRLLAVLLFGFASIVRADELLCPGFLPTNSMKIPVSIESTGLTEEQFNAVLDRIQSVYGPIIQRLGGKLVIQRDWKDATVNAWAKRSGRNYIIHMFGGMARHPSITQDGFAMVACHEIGHHLAGLPYVRGGLIKMAVEGQADYFSTTKCMRRVFGEETAKMTPQPKDSESWLALRSCSSAFRESGDQMMCYRGTEAGRSLASLLNSLGGGAEPSLSTPDPHHRGLPWTLPWSMGGHPPAQCRLDTYYQGALCAKPYTEDFSGKDRTAGACTNSEGYELGVRPRCWYKPRSTDHDLKMLEAGSFTRQLKDTSDNPILQSIDPETFKGL